MVDTVHVFQAKPLYHFIICIFLGGGTDTRTHAQIESLIVTQWDYLEPACGLMNAQTMKGWADACS